MEFNELQQYVDELFEKEFKSFRSKVTSEEEKYMKNLYTGFLIGHWHALEPTKTKEYIIENVTGGDGARIDGARISWWLHVAKGLIEFEKLKGAPTINQSSNGKIDFSAITKAISNP